jgi:hypothetical protein
MNIAERSKWITGDEIAVHFYDMADALIATSIFEATGDGTNVEFARKGGAAVPASGSYNIKAIYPANIAGNSISASFTQSGENADHIGKYDVMSAQKTAVDITALDALDLSFTHQLPLLRFSLKNTNTDDDINISNIVIRSSNSINNFYNSISYYDIKNDCKAFFERNEISLNCSPNIKIDQGGSNVKDFYIILPGNEVRDVADDFIVTVHFTKTSAPSTYLRKEFAISRDDYTFLKTPFAGGNRYYFKLAIGDANIVTVSQGGVSYALNTDTNKASASSYFATGSITILSVVPGYPGSSVTSIEESGFEGTGITDITLPASIENISNSAFKSSNLATINFVGTSKLKSIGNTAFASSALTSITIPASVENIGMNAFESCIGLMSITFEPGSSLSLIRDEAFKECSNVNLTAITIPSVNIIGMNAFYNCANLATVDLPNMLTNIEDYAFQGTVLTSLTLRSTTPPQLGDQYEVFPGLSGLSIQVPTAAVASYNEVLNDISHPKRWIHTSPTGSIDLGSGPVSLLGLSGASGAVTVTASF